MRDPHVVALHYRLETAERFRFADDVQPLEGEGKGKDGEPLHYRLEAGHLCVDLLEHHATAESARAIVRPFVDAWEFDVALRRGRREMRFVFERPEMVDRDPPGPGEPVTINLAGEAAGIGFAAASPTVVASSYPEPPSGFEASADVEVTWHRYERAMDDREPIASAAYAILTTVEARAGEGGGRRERVAALLGIDVEVLRTLGRLASDVGDARTGRKVGTERRPHTGAETVWMQATMRLLIRRVAEYDADPSVAERQRLTMDHLPALPSG